MIERARPGACDHSFCESEDRDRIWVADVERAAGRTVMLRRARDRPDRVVDVQEAARLTPVPVDRDVLPAIAWRTKLGTTIP